MVEEALGEQVDGTYGWKPVKRAYDAYKENPPIGEPLGERLYLQS